MPRIPDEELARLKSSVDLVALIRAKGIELKPHGTGDLVGRCPFHDDKTPSLIVTPAKSLWHCMGACQIGGDVIEWIKKSEGVSFRHAVELLRDGRASTLLSSDKLVRVATVPKLPPPVSLDADEQTLLNQVTDYYHKTLLEDPLGHAAREYLQKRGLFHPEAVSFFRLGYANRTLGLRLPDKNREAGAQIRARLEKLGIFREASGHEHLAGSLIVPILDEHGNTQGLYGRKVIDTLRTGTPKHLYLPGPHRGVFNPDALYQREIILCEALIDALSFWVHGFRNVTSSFGVEGFTEEMFSAFITHGVSRVYIAYDRDEAGDRAAEKLGEKLLSEGIEVLRVLFPHNMDANEYIRKMSPADKALKVLLNGATWIGKGQRPKPLPQPQTVALPSGEQVDTETGEVLQSIEPEPLPSLAAEVALPEASTSPTAAIPEIPHTTKGEDVHITLGDRAYRVRGLHKNLSFEVLKVNLRVTVGESFYLDTLDFYNARARESFVNHAASELSYKADVLKRDLGRLLLLLERLQEEKITEALKPKAVAAYAMTAQEQAEGMAYLRTTDLTGRIVSDLTACGYVGEEVNKLMGYLAATSRKLDDPLSVIIQSNSASGKSSLMDAVLHMVPPEEKTEFSALTGQALFYMAEASLKHKVLSIAEDGGMADAAYAIKGLITDKRLRKAAPGKDPQTGKLVTQTYEVEGPCAVFYSTTAAEVEPELKNRCVVLTLNEDSEQTEAILASQRFAQTLAGKKQKRNRDAIRGLHHNAQRLLRSLTVVNRFAVHLRFSSSQSRLRRDQMKYLGVMNALALLHQYQRPIKRDSDAGEYVEVELSDIALANRLCAEVLGRTLDELAPQTRRLLDLLTAIVKEIAKEKALDFSQVRLTRWDIRKSTRWSDTALKVHLRRLTEMEYLLIHRSSRGLFEYELLYRGEGEDGGRFLLGLIDVEELRKKSEGYDYDFERSGVNGHRSGSGQPMVSPRSGGGPVRKTSLSINNDNAESEGNTQIPENAYRGKAPSSHPRSNHRDKEAVPSLAAVAG